MKNKRNKQCVLTMILAAVLVLIPVFPSEAGLSKDILDGASSMEALDEAKWSNPNEDVTAKNGIFYFPQESTEETRLITRSTTKRSIYTDYLLRTSFVMKSAKIPKSQSFIFAMGLGSIESVSGESGNIEIHFTNNGGLQAEVIAYDDSGEATQVSNKVSCGNVSGDIKVVVELSTKNQLKVTVGKKTVCDAKVPSDGNGSVGFLQTGNCKVEVHELNITFYEYDRPENTNLEEDFEEGIFNANLLQSSLIQTTLYDPCKLQVEKLNDSNVLMFRNVAIGYIGTCHMYSNFELTFDVPYLQTTPIVDEAGNVTSPATSGIGITFGGDSVNFTRQAFGTSTADLLVLSGDGAYAYVTGHSAKVKEHFFGTNGNKKPFNVRVSVIDGVVTLGVKWMNETEYEDFLTYTIKTTPTGYVHIWAPTGRSSSFAIDNVKIVNKDKEPNLIEVDFKAATLDIPEDYKFVPQGLVYNPDAVSQTETELWYLPMVGVLAVCVITFSIVVVCVHAKRKRNGGATDEK